MMMMMSDLYNICCRIHFSYIVLLSHHQSEGAQNRDHSLVAEEGYVT